MSDQDSSTSSSQTEGDTNQSERPPPTGSAFSTLHAAIRIKQKYWAMKRLRQEMVLAGSRVPTGAPSGISPKIFTFEGLTPSGYSALPSSSHQRKKRRRKKRVLFPHGGGRRVPPTKEHSRATYCLYLLCAIVFLQVYNAIENLDDHVLRYDLDGLDKTLKREVFGQQGAVEGLLAQLKEYLSTYVHSKPLVLSLHGPSGVGKSHLGRLLAGHFRSVVGESMVLQYYVLHHCPQEADTSLCTSKLSQQISRIVEQAEEEEKIPLFIFDEAEHMHNEILDTLRELMLSQRSNEYLNVIYLFLSNLGHAHITKHILQNSSSISQLITGAGHSNLIKELVPILHKSLEKLHPLWTEAVLLPLGLLDKSHVMECFLDEMSREGFYPDPSNIERLAGDIEYYPPVGGHKYSKTGCKQVVAKVNLL
ncbi:torsin-4A [Thalassophryne amazonica]|uniref:torsin-4A n=1 Tax=Thalassophryne amazonica TaxID=390379 RepID=UPI0014717C19|nr:torsin-4A [Thalassophryne amazonica]XP_034047948.1 torsin-4A [Thalassophryne amazonica]